MADRPARRRAVERVGWGVVLLTLAALVSAAAPPALGATSASVSGTVTAAGKPLASARVTVLAGSRTGAVRIGRATTDSAGHFTLSYASPAAGVLYVEVTPSAASSLRLRTVVGAGSGGVAARTVATVTVNELTTVAAGYALAQFSGTDGISGPSPGLENAAATAFNLVDSVTGKPGEVVTNANNGSKNETLATLGTLANLISLCAPGSSVRCGRFLALATPPGGATPTDSAQAVVNLARNPTLSTGKLYALARAKSLYEPALDRPPTAWILVLLYTDTDLFASGRIAIDAEGNVWSSTNWKPGTQKGATSITALDPVGAPTFGSPISGGGMKGGAWGAVVAPGDGNVWMGSFAGASIVKYSPSGTILSPGDGYTDGGPKFPQGMAVDQRGNIWIANNYGPESAPGEGNVLVYPGGDPAKAITITGGGLNHPFAVQIDGYGRAWVTNAGLGGARLVGTRAAIAIGKFGGSVTVIGPDFEPTSFSPVEDDSFKWPLGLSIDSQNNAWIANYFGSTITQIGPDGGVAGVYELPKGTLPWSQAVDGSDRVWVAGFARDEVWLLCGVDTSSCPPGSATGAVLSPRLGFRSKAFQHFTSVQIDQAGNLWLSNNWSKLVPPAGGTGIAEIVGAATPVCAPLTPLPVQPSSASDVACPQQTAAELPASLDGTSSDGIATWVWVAIGVAAVVGIAAAAAFLVRRSRSRPA